MYMRLPQDLRDADPCIEQQVPSAIVIITMSTTIASYTMHRLILLLSMSCMYAPTHNK